MFTSSAVDRLFSQWSRRDSPGAVVAVTRHGEVIQVFDGLRNIHMLAEICDPMHFDRENARLHA